MTYTPEAAEGALKEAGCRQRKHAGSVSVWVLDGEPVIGVGAARLFPEAAVNLALEIISRREVSRQLKRMGVK